MRRWCRSARFAWQGILETWRRQRNFRIECALGAVAVLVAVWLRAPLAPVLLACALVLSLELMNSALEAVVDLVSPGSHELARVAKDAAAGAVLIASILAVGVAVVLFVPRLLALAGG